MEAEVMQTADVAMTWLTTVGLQLAKNVLVFFIVIGAGVIAGRIAARTVRLALERSPRLDPSPLLKQFATNVTRKSIILVSFVIGLGNLGIDTGALVAGLGVSGLVLGFALKDTLSNFASGGLILLYRPFDVGHFVEISGTTGVVRDLTLVSTILTTPDNKVVTLPNSSVWGKSITNFSASPTRRIDIIASIAYSADIDTAKEIFMDILTQHELVLDDPAPVVTLRELGDSSVDFNVRGWVQTADYWPVHADLLRQIKYRLDGAGIGIPFPQREVWMHQVSADRAPAREKTESVF
jgi:small conductance mechanosensitive channel